MIRFGLFGNRGEYRMPYTPEFDTVDTAREYREDFYPGNRWVIILPL